MYILKKIDSYIDKSIRLKIFFHDSGFFIIRKIREERFKSHFCRTSEIPEGIQLEITTLCNADCAECWISGITRPRTIMNEALFKKIVDECSIYKPKFFQISWIGEPTLDPGLVDKIKYIKKSCNAFVFFFTNGSLLNEKLSVNLIESGLDEIIFSFDGISKETYGTVRKGLNFEIVINNFNNLIELRKKHNRKKPRIGVSLMLTKYNIHEEKQFKKEWLPKIDHAIYCTITTENRAIYYPYRNNTCYRNKGPCNMVFHVLPVYVNGLVGLCRCCTAREELIMGDLTKQSVKDIWNSSLFKKYRDYHMQGKFNELPICDTCTRWKYAALREPWWW